MKTATIAVSIRDATVSPYDLFSLSYLNALMFKRKENAAHNLSAIIVFFFSLSCLSFLFHFLIQNSFMLSTVMNDADVKHLVSIFMH